MNHAPPHWDRVLQDLIGNAKLLERMNPARGNREINRTTPNNIAFAGISPAFVKIDIVSAPAQICRKQSTSETGTDQNKFCLGHSMLSFCTCNSCTANTQHSTFNDQHWTSESAENLLTADHADITDFQIKQLTQNPPRTPRIVA